MKSIQSYHQDDFASHREEFVVIKLVAVCNACVDGSSILHKQGGAGWDSQYIHNTKLYLTLQQTPVSIRLSQNKLSQLSPRTAAP